MKKLLKVIAIVVVAVVGAIVIVGLFLPTRYEVKREIVVDAPAEMVHALVGDLNRWPEWEPWRDSDPTIQVTLGDQAVGVGASQSWKGKSGTGELVLTASDPATGIAYDLVFDEVYVSKVAVSYSDSAGGGTRVAWVMVGEADAPIVGGYFARLMNPMVGPMFESGLNKLKAATEADMPAEEVVTDIGA